MALPSLPALPALGGGFHPDFLPGPTGPFGGGFPPIDPGPGPGGGGGGGGGGGTGPGCTQIKDSSGRVISQTGNCPGGATGGFSGWGAGQTAAAAAGCAWYDVVCFAGSSLLRFALFLLGLLALAGAIYLYKGSGVIGQAVKTVKRGAHGAVRAISEGAEV
jgi:hypothetical protein